jgi:hypothetical protein
VLTNKKFIKFAREELVVLIAHNELGHDSVEEKGYDGKTRRACPLYPGMTCREHCDASVDVDVAREEGLTKVPFIELCPNSWLVPPVGKPEQIPEEEQFSAAKVQKRIEVMRKAHGPAQTREVYRQILNAFGQADAALDEEAWKKSLQALVGIEGFVKKPHAALKALVDQRMASIEEQVRWEYEDAIDVGRNDTTLMSERIATLNKLIEAVDLKVYGKAVPVLAEMRAWVKDHA